MSEQRVRFEGVTCSEQYLRVFFSVGDRLAKRVREVKVPYSDLVDTEVVAFCDSEARARLRALWEQSQAELPW